MVGWWMAGTGDGLLTGRSGGWNSTSGSTDRFDGKVRTKLSYSNKLAQGCGIGGGRGGMLSSNVSWLFVQQCPCVEGG